MPIVSSTANALRSATTRIDVSSATAPSSGQVLTATGPSAATWQTSSSGSSGPTTRFATVFETVSAFSISLISGTAAVDASGLLMSTTATASRSAEVSRNVPGSSNNPFLGSPSMSCSFANFTPVTGFGSITVGGGTSSTSTVAHFGFMIDVVASVATLSASQASGTTQTKTTLTTITGSSDSVDVYAKVNGTTSIDYYWRKNGAAWSTATNQATNMPTGTNTSLMDLFVSNSNGNMQLRFNSYTYER